MKLFKVLYYFEILQIASIMTMLFYLVPLRVLLGEHLEALRGLIIALLCGLLMWKINSTFHYLLEKWKLKR